MNQKEVEKQIGEDKSGEREKIKEESKKKADCRSITERIEVSESRKYR